ncbi:glycosyltransferase family 39 protein [candidate division KSB1 bacterium]|nr:glycosyltransferase family 39 protein [candidate division KSB1 bacterium]
MYRKKALPSNDFRRCLFEANSDFTMNLDRLKHILKNQPAAIPPLIICLVALLFRMIYLSELRHSPLFYFPQVDADTYVHLAYQIADGSFFTTNSLSFYQAPLYPFVLAFIFKTVSSDLFWIHLLQFILGTINCVLIYSLGKACFNKSFGVLSGLLASVYWTFIYFEGELLLPTAAIFLDLCFLILFIGYLKKRTIHYAIFSGLLLGLSAIARPNILLFGWLACPLLMLLPSSAIFQKPGSLAAKANFTRIFFFLVSSMIVIAPVTIYNYSVEKSFVLISHNGGLNFYIGNSSPAERTLDIRPGEEWEIFTATPKLENLSIEFTGAQFSGYWYRKSLDWFRQHPSEFIINMAKKAIQFFHAYEFKRNLDIYFFKAHYSKLLAFPFIGFSLIGPLGLLGMFITRRNDLRQLVLIAFVLFYALSVIIFFVTSRYRLPVVPILIIFASSAIVHLVDQFKKREIRWKSLVLLALAACFVNIDFCHFKPDPAKCIASEAESWYYIGRALGERAENEISFDRKTAGYDEAISTMQKSVALDSGFAYPITFIGIYKIDIVKLLLKDLLTANLNSNEYQPLFGKAMTLLQESEAHFRQAHTSDPRLTSPLYNLCLALYYRNIVEFNNPALPGECVRTNIINRCDEIEQITSTLLNGNDFKKFDKFIQLREKARFQKMEIKQ